MRRSPFPLHPVAVARSSQTRRWLHAVALPMLAAGVLVALSGCGTMDGSGARGANGSSTSASAPNAWPRHMEAKREAITRVSLGTGVVVTRTADNQLKLNLPADIGFDAGRSDLKPAIRPVLDELARGLDGDVRITVVGHTDSSAPAESNDQLSLDRAEAVREYLVHHGVQRGRLLVEGRGARQPVVSNATEAGRAANRRMEIFLSQPAS